jgi:hypothetical protein
MDLSLQLRGRGAWIGCRALLIGLIACMAAVTTPYSHASDHLDTRTVIDDPRADIGDLYAWISNDAKRLNLVMTIVGHAFSPELRYVFHVDSGKRFGKSTASATIACTFVQANTVSCRFGDVDSAQGAAGDERGIESRNKRFRVFAGLRDDPFFNNVKGSRDAYQVAAAALKAGARLDGAGCPNLDQATSRSLLDQWRHTDGGPGTNFLAGWTPASLVISIDIRAVSKGGAMLAVWATTSSSRRQMDRMGRPLTGNAMLAPLAADDVSDKLKEQYNAATPATAGRFVPEIEKTLGLYDSFDGKCGNSLLSNPSTQSPERYRALATLLADDRLWIDSNSSICSQFFAVELANLTDHGEMSVDCGGRTPNYDAVDAYRSLLVNGTVTGVDDGVDRDDHEHSTTDFPFLAPP